MTIRGDQLIAKALAAQGVENVYGIVGFPVYGLASAIQKEGIRYLGFRNEQAASYAAAAAGYLTGRPGVCLTVSGPGVVHAVAGLSNAWANHWPMLLLGGASDAYQDGMGAFQEAPQVEAARPFCKYAARIDSVERVGYYVEQAVRTSFYGRPGPAFLDLPNDILSGETDEDSVTIPRRTPDAPRSLADPASIDAALAALAGAERPLAIVGKGAAYARAEEPIRAFIEQTQLPFLATPMGSGVVPDSHPLSVGAARSYALQNADLVLLLGARLNWILHFGLPPRFGEDVDVLQVDIAAEEMGHNRPNRVAMVGDARAVVEQLNAGLAASSWTFSAEAPWRKALREAGEPNVEAVQAMVADDNERMGYYRVLGEIHRRIPQEAVLVAEGANTMDISRSVVTNERPRRRIDAGSFGTMGVGLGQAIAAAVTHEGRPVIAIEGDSAFGFSGMEMETICRYQLPVKVLIVNNNGIAGGLDELDPDRPPPPFAYTPGAAYEKMAEAFGARGFRVETLSELGPALDAALAHDGPVVVNVLIDPKASRKPQKFDWLTR